MIRTALSLALGGLLAAAPAPAQRHRPAPPPARMPDLPPAVIDDALAIGGDEIDGRTVSTRMTVDIRVNAQGPYRFVVDSGADTSVIGQRRARALALPAGTPVTLHGTTSSDRVERVRVDTLDLGQSTIHDLELPVLMERNLGADGLIGIDALVEQRLMLDFEARTIRIEDARTPVRGMDGDIIVVARRRRGQLILTQARAAGRPVDAVIDTGSEVTIGNLALRDQLLRRQPEGVTTVKATGVTGVTVDLQIARVAELRLGPIVLRDVPIAFADVPPFAVFGLANRPALLLGTDLMETFRRVSLDFRARKVRFQLRRCRAGFVTPLSSAAAVSSVTVNPGGEAACRR